MLQPLSLAAPPVSASLLFKDGIPAESARAAAHLLRVRQALRYPASPYATCYESAPFHGYLTSLGSRS